MLKMPISEQRCLETLSRLGFSYEIKDIVAIARSRIDKSIYRRGADPKEWPDVLDCSGLTKWSYGQMGVWLPRHSIDQRSFRSTLENLNDLKPGDLVFTSGLKNYFWDNPEDGVGHVGLLTSNNSIVHAANSKRHIVEDYLDQFTTQENFRGAMRVTEDLSGLYTIKIPEKYSIETSTAIRWKILQNLK